MRIPTTPLRLRALLLLLGLLVATGGIRAQAGAALKACASHTPPFMLFTQGQAVGGFSLELLQLLAKQTGHTLQVNLLPWARCLQNVKTGALDLAIDAYDDAERRKTYWYSAPYHTLTPQIFYRTGSRLDAMPIRQARDLEPLRGCGVHDYTYEHYDLEASKLDLGAANDATMLRKVIAGHCDYAVEELEYIVGGRGHSANWPDETGLKSMQPRWARGPKLHFLIGKGQAQGRALQAQLNQAIALAEKSGQAAALRKKYFASSDKPAKQP